jgi:hypothetical protein
MKRRNHISENRAETSCLRTMIDIHVRLKDKNWLCKHILPGGHQLILNMWLFWYNKAFIWFQTAIINYTREAQRACAFFSSFELFL